MEPDLFKRERESLHRMLAPPKSAVPAKWTHERIGETIANFEKSLSPDQEVGGRVANFGNMLIHIDDLGYWGPDMLFIHGFDENGNRVELIQHYTQVSILLVAVPKVGEIARRMGFRRSAEQEKSSECEESP